MTRRVHRKSEAVRLRNEHDFPHLVELVLPPEGFRGVLLEIDAFHRERRIPVRRGRNRHEIKQVYIRFCFPDAASADAFRNRFGGECLTHAATSSDALFDAVADVKFRSGHVPADSVRKVSTRQS